ncbi:MAG TPA: hypothetical protein VFW75_05565 [Acetobacteraceae bacterium]|nr:hypothetical protein [Acetobacteraceae bacterium]
MNDESRSPLPLAGEVNGRGADSTQRGSTLAIAQHLAVVLAAENAALLALDLPAAVAMLGAKHSAVEAFAALQPEPGAGQRDATHRTQWAIIGRQLIDLAAENRALLERAIAVQARVLGVIAQAGRRESAAKASGYGARGHLRAAPRPVAVAIFARA